MSKTLSSCAVGEAVIVVELLPSVLTSKLMEMGIYSGKEIQIVYTAPFGDPIAVNIGSYVLSMRKEEAAIILVEPQKFSDED